MGVPVLEGALDRSVQLAASMDARGYGRTSVARPAGRRLAGGCCIAGLLATAGGLFIVLDGAPVGGVGVALLVAGAASLVAGLFVGSRHAVRTRYRPDPWRLPEWVVSLSGLAVLAAFLVVGAVHPGALQPPVSPLRLPSPAPAAALAVFLGLLPAVAAPPPEPTTTRSTAASATTLSTPLPLPNTEPGA
jgi:energy-coupling factor transport system permease protein